MELCNELPPNDSYNTYIQELYKHINKLTLAQGGILEKFDNLYKNVDELRKIIIQFSDKLTSLEETVSDRKKLKGDIKNLKMRVDELYDIVKDGKEDRESQASERDAESCASDSSKVAMATGLDKDMIRAAYEDVRSDQSPTEWAVFKFDGLRIICAARGSDFTEFRTKFSDDERAFGYLRLQMGDEMSKRQKFLFITWVGPNVSVINRAKMSTDKAIMKDIISNFAVELQLESQAEIDIDQFKDALNRAGGANYGTGVRVL